MSSVASSSWAHPNSALIISSALRISWMPRYLYQKQIVQHRATMFIRIIPTFLIPTFQSIQIRRQTNEICAGFRNWNIPHDWLIVGVVWNFTAVDKNYCGRWIQGIEQIFLHDNSKFYNQHVLHVWHDSQLRLKTADISNTPRCKSLHAIKRVFLLLKTLHSATIQYDGLIP